ncbi:Neuropeptide FF receptor 1 [Bulinus truncatus]|nr:Neuropeptide FF receptor 1 [Bulinus truncatus]
MNVSHNYTSDEIEQYLSLLQHESTIAFIPTIVYLCLLIVVGSVGNCLVLYVYSTRMTRTPLRIFIICMAVSDLPTNIIVIPGEIYDLFHVWDFDQPLTCKLRRYLNGVFLMSSSFVLLAIAAARYNIVCRPFGKQLTITQAKIISVTIMIIALVTSIPYCIIYGSQTIETPNPKIFGHFCQVDDDYVKTKWPRIISAFYLLVFIVGCIAMVVLYTCIGLKTWRHTHQMYHVAQQDSTSALKSTRSKADSSSIVSEKQTAVNKTFEKDKDICSKNRVLDSNVQKVAADSGIIKTVRYSPKTSAEQHVVLCNGERSNSSQSHSCLQTSSGEELSDDSLSSSENISNAVAGTQDKRATTSNKHKGLLKRKGTKRLSIFGRTTWTMIAVSLVFVLGFFPFLSLHFYKTAAPKDFAALRGVPLALFHLFFRSYLLNSSLNPIVYSLLDPRFRRECLKLLN